MNIRRCIKYCAASLLVLAMGLGCGAPTHETNILFVGNGTEPEGLDPHIVTGVPEHHILISVFEGLVRADPADLSPTPGVAERWEVSEDGLVYTFYLRADAKWSNGDALTAADFLYAWKRILTPSLAGEYSYMLHSMKNAKAYNDGSLVDFTQVGAKALDDHTLEVTLNNPTPYFLALHTHYTWFPVHRQTIEKFGAIDERNTKWTRPGNLVGNGPFVLSKWEPNAVIEVRRNTHYWANDRTGVDGVNFYPISLAQTEERMFRAGDLHITENVPLSKIPLYFEKNPELIHTWPWIGNYYYKMNVTRKPFDDVRVRRALAMSLDRDAITTNILKANEQPANYFTPPDLNGYNSPARIEYDIDQARQLLADAGYPGGEGFPTIDILYNTNEAHKIIAVAVQHMWKQSLGINITISNQDWKVYMDAQDNLDYDIVRAGWIGDFVDPINFLECFMTGNGNNRTGWGSPEYDAFLEEARRVNNLAERNKLYGLAETILMEEVPLIPIYFYTRKKLISPIVHGYETNVLDYMPYDLISLDKNES